jgi:hypothetical protein
MCVTLSGSRKLACISGEAGILAVGIGVYNSANRITKGATGVTAIDDQYGVATIARFEVKSTTANYVENGVSGGDNRSKGVTGNLPIILNVPKSDGVKTVTEVEKLLSGEVVLFLERKDGTITVAGSQNGAMAITIDDQTGGTIGDLNGFTVTFQTMETDFSRGYLLVGDALTDYAAALKAVV